MKIYTSMPGIRTRRRRLGLTATSLAAELGVTRQAWNQWEGGATMPSAGYLPAIAALLQCGIEDLYESEGEDHWGRPFAGALGDAGGEVQRGQALE